MGGRELDIEGGSSAPSPFAVLDPARALRASSRECPPGSPSPPRVATISRRGLEEGCFHAPVPFGETLGWGSCKPSQSLRSFAAESSAGACRRESSAGACRRLSKLLPRSDAVPKVQESAFPWVRRTTTGVSRTAWGAFQGRQRRIILVMHARAVRALQDAGTPAVPGPAGGCSVCRGFLRRWRDCLACAVTTVACGRCAETGGLQALGRWLNYVGMAGCHNLH